MISKQILKRVLPGPAVIALRALRRAPNSLAVANLRRRHHRLNAGLGLGTLRLRPGLTLQVEPAAQKGFEAYCWWWPEMVRELDCFLALSRSKTTLLDIGALHGLFSLAFVHGRPEVRAVAVEPEPNACSVIEAHLRTNALTNVVLAKVAVGAQAGAIPMMLRGPHLEAVSDLEMRSDAGDVLAIASTTVDELCRDLDLHPDIIKIDVEGYELHVLRGAERVLREDRPDIALELHPQQIAQLDGSVADLVAYLAELGYGFRDLRGRPISRQRLQEGGRWAHVVCSAGDGR